jgi:mono/diheme cytochrome c family protein
VAEKVKPIWMVAAMSLVVVAAGTYRTFAQTAGQTTAKAAGQSTGKAPTRTTLAGVYTPGQADKGEDTYYGICVNCHPRGTYAGDSFKKNWNGRPLSDLYDWVLNKMPKSAPGTLSPAESIQVVAYILRENKMPPGTIALPANAATLGTIRIQLK